MTFTYLVSKNLRKLRVHFVVVATLLFIGIGAIHPHAASAATYSDTGEPEHQLPERVHGNDSVLGAGFQRDSPHWKPRRVWQLPRKQKDLRL